MRPILDRSPPPGSGHLHLAVDGHGIQRSGLCVFLHHRLRRLPVLTIVAPSRECGAERYALVVICRDPPSLRPRRKSHRSGTSGGQSSSRSARNSYNGTSTDPWVMGDSSTTSSIGSSAAVQRVKRPTSGILHSSRSHYSGTRRFDHSGTFVIEADVEENSLI